MFQRVMVAVIGIPALLLIFSAAPAWATMILMAAMCAVGAYELLHAIAAGETGKRLVPLTMLAAALTPLCIYSEETVRAAQPFTSMPVPPLTAVVALVFVFCLFVRTIVRYGTERAIPFADVTGAIFAGIVFPLMLSCLLRLRMMEHGTVLIWTPLAISFGSDTCALFAGMFFGKHKLAPLVSPKKTKEGAVGGLVGGVAGLAILKGVLLLMGSPSAERLAWSTLLLLGLLGSVISQIGDLSFSVIKREYKIKDYGKLLPGHGGVLDRFDSVTFVAPFVWFIFSFL